MASINPQDETRIRRVLNKWKPELMNPSRYPDIVGVGTGLKLEHGQIKVPYELCIVIYVKHLNARTALIPQFLDGVSTQLVDTGGGVVAAN